MQTRFGNPPHGAKRLALGAALATALCTGCYGGLAGVETAGEVADGGRTPDGNADPEDQVPACAAQMESAPLRRMTRVQYDNTLRDLLGVTGSPAQAIEADERVGPFFNNAIAPVAPLTVEQYMQVAEQIAADVSADPSAVLPCDAAADHACAEAFIEDFVSRAYRRPTTAAERQRYEALYEQGRADGGVAQGVRLVVQLALQSPHFLYHVEGSPQAPADEVVPLDEYSVASRLSYLLWETMPDAALFDAAAAGELQTREGLLSQADRLLADPRSIETLTSFHLQWFGVTDVTSAEKDPDLFPQFDPALARSMQQETARFVEHVFERDDGRLATLLSAPYSLPDSAIAELYGLDLPPDHPIAEPVSLPRRAGLLTQPSVLAAHAHATQTSPVQRGVFIRESVLCQTLPPPPPNVDNTPPPPDPSATTRERYARHKEDPACAGCHVLIDDLGLAFEHYDAIGVWRDVENGTEIDASGQLKATDVDGRFDDALQLATMLADSWDVQACVVQQWFRFAFGRSPALTDVCVVDELTAGFRESGGDVKQLMRSLVAADAFRYRRAQ